MGCTRTAFRGWRLALNATNLFNKEYVASCYNTNFCNYGELRSVIASARYRW